MPSDLRFCKEELIVRHIGKNATVLYELKRSLLLGTSPSIRREAAQFFSATRMQTPDQGSCPSPDGGVLLKGITPKLFAAKGNRASR